MERQRQAGGAGPTWVIVERTLQFLKAFRKRDRWHLLHWLLAEVLLPQPLSKFILKAQSVYTCISISLNGIVPPFAFCFVLFFFYNGHWSFWRFDSPSLFLILSHLSLSLVIYSRMHFLLVLVSGGSKAARMASSNTFLSPRWLKRKGNRKQGKKLNSADFSSTVSR